MASLKFLDKSNSVIGVEIETIASFNQMKQLCGDISLIVKAMKLCPSVEVSTLACSPMELPPQKMDRFAFS